MLQDFSFKILHRPGLKHTNVDALSKNPMGQATNDDDFSEEIQDVGTIQNDPTQAIERIFSVQYGQDSEWFGFRRHSWELTEHRKCCSGINHWRCSEDHQLFMLDVVTETNQVDEANPRMEVVEAADDEDLGPTNGKQDLRKEMTKYYDKQQQLELVLAVQELSEFGDLEFGPTESGEEENREMDTRNIDIWRDATCLGLLKEGMLPDTVDLEESKRAQKESNQLLHEGGKALFQGTICAQARGKNATCNSNA